VIGCAARVRRRSSWGAGSTLGLRAVGGDHVGDGPVVAVGEQDPFAEQALFQPAAGQLTEAVLGLGQVWSRPRAWAAFRVGEWVSTARRVAPSAVTVVSSAVRPQNRSASTAR